MKNQIKSGKVITTFEGFMIQITVIHLLSVIISIIINRINYLGCLNSITARGKYVIKYPFDILYNYLFGMTVIQYLIPFYNIIKSFSCGVNVINTMDKLYETLNNQNLLESNYLLIY